MSRAGASEIERVVGEWLVLKCCDSTAVCLERVPLKRRAYMGNGLFFPQVFVRYDANDVCLERRLLYARKRVQHGD